ncbi:MAG: methyltransferase domain-containing protein [Opitutus sp.]
MPVLAAIDFPPTGSLNDPLALQVEGWLYGGENHAAIEAIEICCDGERVGETSILLERPDVVRYHTLPAGTLTGFVALVCAPQLFGREVTRLECRARFRDASTAIGTVREVRLIRHDHRENHYGALVRPEETRLFHRSDIYTSGPSVAEISPDCLALVKRYLPPAPVRVLDVGCGFGGYGRALLAAGYEWFGVEVKESDCVELTRMGLPHQRVDGRTLPFADATYDSAICIEVLEHIENPEAFLSEIRRVTRRRLLVSVPNLELIPYLNRYLVVPWHLLEGDHKNFFTRPSLWHLLAQYFRKVEVLTYAPIPIRTPEGLPLHNHLFAICDV